MAWSRIMSFLRSKCPTKRTDQEIIATAAYISSSVVLSWADIQGTFLRHSYILPTTRTAPGLLSLSVSDCTKFESVFLVSDAFSIWSFLVVMLIMVELICNRSNVIMRPISKFHHGLMCPIIFANGAFFLFRWAAAYLEYNQVFMWRPIICLLLQILLWVGYVRLRRRALARRDEKIKDVCACDKRIKKEDEKEETKVYSLYRPFVKRRKHSFSCFIVVFLSLWRIVFFYFFRK